MSSETDNHEPDCRGVEPLLDDLVDGQLSEALQRRVRRHLASCEACADRLQSLEKLLAAVDALPRDLEPETDLWADIEPRLTARRPRRAENRWAAWSRQAVAAVLFMALGGVLTQLLVPGGRGDSERPSVHAALERPADPVAEFALAEADYLRAKEALWGAVYSSRDSVSPATREVVEHNLRVIDGAIRELRSALENDPGNPQLENLLLAQHRTEIGLLRRLARTTEI